MESTGNVITVCVLQWKALRRIVARVYKPLKPSTISPPLSRVETGTSLVTTDDVNLKIKVPGMLQRGNVIKKEGSAKRKTGSLGKYIL